MMLRPQAVKSPRGGGGISSFNRKHIKWGRISSGKEYQVGKNIKWGRISVTSGKVYKMEKNIKLGSISSGEEYQKKAEDVEMDGKSISHFTFPFISSFKKGDGLIIGNYIHTCHI